MKYLSDGNWVQQPVTVLVAEPSFSFFSARNMLFIRNWVRQPDSWKWRRKVDDGFKPLDCSSSTVCRRNGCPTSTGTAWQSSCGRVELKREKWNSCHCLRHLFSAVKFVDFYDCFSTVQVQVNVNTRSEWKSSRPLNFKDICLEMTHLFKSSIAVLNEVNYWQLWIYKKIILLIFLMFLNVQLTDLFYN